MARLVPATPRQSAQIHENHLQILAKNPIFLGLKKLLSILDPNVCIISKSNSTVLKFLEDFLTRDMFSEKSKFQKNLSQYKTTVGE